MPTQGLSSHSPEHLVALCQNIKCHQDFLPPAKQGAFKSPAGPWICTRPLEHGVTASGAGRGGRSPVSPRLMGSLPCPGEPRLAAFRDKSRAGVLCHRLPVGLRLVLTLLEPQFPRLYKRLDTPPLPITGFL